MVSRRGGFLKNLDQFDATFFGISPREAPHVDPRQRLLMEIAWEALEHAGIPPDSLAGKPAGVYIASLTNDYDHLLFEDLRRAEAYSGAGTANSVLANRISYFLDLRGPSLVVDTACSGSLVALHLACEGLQRGETSLALAGGVNVNLMPKSNVFFSRAGALSPNGRCATFDKNADGMVRSDGAGIVVLKLLSKALADNDPVIAVIKGSAINHDGRSNGIMAPNGQAQEAVLREAYRRAGIEPKNVQYVEAHGTGTRLGDPIEVQALGSVLGDGRLETRKCVLGSAKTNFGHTEAAAGIAGIIKTALAIQRRVLPPTLHFQEPNPLIGLDRFPFAVRTELSAWPSESEPLIAGVSAFGFGGTNAHVVLTEAPAKERRAEEGVSRAYVLPLSARTPEGLRGLAGAYREFLHNTDAKPADICYTAAAGRSHHGYRLAACGRSREELRTELEQWLSRPDSDLSPDKPRVAFVFSGQGSHWAGMGRDLYEQYPIFRAALNECDAIFARLRPMGQESSGQEDDTTIAQPAIFSIEVALAALWKSWGVTPDVVVGHSLGEAAAAYVSGALTLEEAAQVVYERSRLMKRVAGRGKTAVVGLPFEEARQAIRGREDRLAVAGTNSPTTSVLSGEPESLAELLRRLGDKGIFCRELQGVEIAFHSPQMDPLIPELVDALSGLRPRATAIPILSTVTASYIDGQNLNASYWGRNLREPFLFTSATEQLLEDGYTTILEVSPHPVLGSAILQTVQRAKKKAAVLASVRRNENGREQMLESVARLYALGQNIAWKRVYPGQYDRVALPHYPWQRQRYWFDQIDTGSPQPRKQQEMREHPLLGERVDAAGEDGLSLWQMELDPEDLAYLTEHRVQGEIVLPAAASAEMMLEAAAQLFPGSRPSIVDVTFESPLRLERGQPRHVQLAVSVRSGEATASLYSRASKNAPWTRHVNGKLRGENADQTVNLRTRRSAPPPCGQQISPEEHYRQMEARGLQYGASFRAIRTLWGGDREALAEIELSATQRDARYRVHPTLLDASLQVVAAALRGTSESDNSYIPSGLRSWQVMRPGCDRFSCHAQVVCAPNGSTIEANINLMAEDGELIATLQGLQLKPLPKRTQRLKNDLLELRWEAVPLGTQKELSGRWLILGGDDSVTDELRIQLTRPGCETISARYSDDIKRLLDEAGPIDGVIHLWSLDARSIADVETLVYGSSLQLIQAASRFSPQPRLVFATRNAQPVSAGALQVEQSALWGLTLTANQEYPELNCTCVDLDATDDASTSARVLVRELEAADGERRIGWRNGARYAARLGRSVVGANGGRGATKRTGQFAPHGTVLITGGLGALGLLTARALVSRGAKNLVLLGRRAGEHPTIEELRRSGAHVEIYQADVSRLDEVERVFARIALEMPPLAGVIHAAGILEDGLLDNQSLAAFERVAAPKIKGAWNLHSCSKDLPLDFFCCFSSAASLVGSSGQANYAAANAFLDALAHHRRALGLPALSINWGIWNEAGMGGKETLRRMSARGVMAIEPDAGTDLLLELLGIAAPQIGVFPVEWPKFLAQYFGRAPRLFSNFEQSAIPRENFASEFSSIPLEERTTTLKDRVRQMLATTLAIDSSAYISAHERFFELGMDSLTAMEFRNRLQVELGVTLPSTLAFDYPTLDALTGYLKTLVAAKMEEPVERNELTDPELDALSHDEVVRLLAQELGESFAHAG
jgi:myxalamid-type polyketide synthase MxaE and MxaD